MLQIILDLLIILARIWFSIGALCWVLPMAYACLRYNHKLTKLDLIMFFKVTGYGCISLDSLIQVISKGRSK